MKVCASLQQLCNLLMHILCEGLSFNVFRSSRCEILDELKPVLCDLPSFKRLLGLTCRSGVLTDFKIMMHQSCYYIQQWWFFSCAKCCSVMPACTQKQFSVHYFFWTQGKDTLSSVQKVWTYIWMYNPFLLPVVFKSLAWYYFITQHRPICGTEKYI